MMQLVTPIEAGQAATSAQVDGWACRLLHLLTTRAGSAWAERLGRSKKHLALIETMPLGGRRQLMLISCNGRQFLVGTGAESVQTIVQVREADVVVREGELT